MHEPDPPIEPLPDEALTRGLEDDLALAEAAMAHVESGDLEAAEQAVGRLRSPSASGRAVVEGTSEARPRDVDGSGDGDGAVDVSFTPPAGDVDAAASAGVTTPTAAS